MTNLTIKEKQALEEIFLCFVDDKKWYQVEIYSKKLIIYKALRFYAKNRNAVKKYVCIKKRLIFKS